MKSFCERSADLFENFSASCSYKNDPEEHLLIDLLELPAPLFDIDGLVAVVRLLVLAGGWIILIVFAPLDNFLKNAPRTAGGMLTCGARSCGRVLIKVYL